MKEISFSRRSLRFLVWPGLALTTAGLVAGGLAGWQWLPGVLVILGLGLLVVGLSFSGGAFWQQRSTQSGTNAAVAVLAVLAIVGLVNFVAVRYSSRIDLTENQIFTLAPASQQLTQQLQEPVKVVIFDGTQNPQDVQLLESYRRQSAQFSYEYVDPYANPQQAQVFGATAPGMVFLEMGEDRRFLQSVGAAAAQGMGTPERLSERRLTNALDQIINDRALTVYFVQGHEEYAIDGSESGYLTAATSLEDKSYRVEPLNLAETQTVPEDADVVVVAGPAQAFFEAEVTALRDYLASGGSALLLLDPQADGGLTPILDDWGVVLDDRLVLDTSGSGQFVGLGPAAPLVSQYGEHPITQEFGSGRSFFPLVRPVETQEVPEVTATPLLLTSAQSRAEPISEQGDLAFDPEAAPDGPYVLGVALSRPVPDTAATPADPQPELPTDEGPVETPAEGGEAENGEGEPEPAQREARLVVIGNSSFASDGLFDQQLNGDVFLNSVNWLGQQGDEALSIRPKEVTNRRILITPQQQVGLIVFALLVLPLTGIALAVLMWLRRR